MVNVSVIIPVYKVEKYITKAIESILSQTYKNFELILVDDGSPDKSGEICDYYASKDNRVNVIHTANMGVANARNIGISKAVGKYIYFLDSDDWVEAHFLERITSYAESMSVDMVICGYNMVYSQEDKKTIYPVVVEDALIRDINNFKKKFYYYLKKNLLNTPWNKLYLRDIIVKNKIEFKNVHGEDLYFNIDYFKLTKSIYISSEKFYYWYRSRGNSITQNIYSDKNIWEIKLEIFKQLKELYVYWGIDSGEERIELNRYFADRIIQCIQEIMANKKITFDIKKKSVRNILSDKETRNIINNVKAESFLTSICYLPIKFQNLLLCIIMGTAINYIKNNFSNYFLDLRSKQVYNSHRVVD